MPATQVAGIFFAPMLLCLGDADADGICGVPNDAASAYRGVIPADRLTWFVWRVQDLPRRPLRGARGTGPASLQRCIGTGRRRRAGSGRIDFPITRDFVDRWKENP